MKRYALLLKELCEPLLDAPYTAKGVVEEYDVYHHKIDIDREKLSRLQSDKLQATLTEFGEFIQIGLERAYSETPTPVAEYEDISDYLSDYSSDTTHTLTIRVDKAGLLRREFPIQNSRVVWLITPEHMTQEWTRNLIQIENIWFPDNSPLVLLVEKPGCQLSGEWISVLGTDLDNGLLKSYVEKQKNDEACTLLAERARQRSLETRWLSGAKRLLPEQLFCSPVADGTRYPDIEEPLFKKCMDLIVCSLANLTEPNLDSNMNPSSWLARFEGQKQVLVETGGLTRVDFDSCQIWFNLYRLVYNSSKVNEAMGILRNLLTLQPYDQATKNYSLLVDWGDELTKSVQSHYNKFIGSSVDQYFAKLKESSAFFQGKVDALGKQISDLIDAFLKNLLAVFGVVTGTVLVKSIDSTTQSQKLLPYLFISFTAYVFIVTLFYYLVSWKSFNLTKTEYDKNISVAKSFFTDEDLKKYIGTAFKERVSLFQITFWTTFSIYAILFLVGFIGIFVTWDTAQKATVAAQPSPSATAPPTAPPSSTPPPGVKIPKASPAAPSPGTLPATKTKTP